MRSNICTIEKGTRDLEAILKESESVAKYNNLDEKQTLQLRLLCEELDGMLPNIIDDFSGDFWIDFDSGVCKINAAIKIPEFDAAKKEELINVAKNKKNASAVGLVGKIRDAIEDFFLDDARAASISTPPASLFVATGFSEGVDYSYLWSLKGYKSAVEEDKAEAWDELEKSMISSVADDVIVGIKGNKANIIIVKSFV